ncbi:MAG: 23S rRNA (guanosine(2251)-2'-O)-methyltransferase RlmB [Bacilli bacterium]
MANESIISGKNAVTEALSAGREINKILLADNQQGSPYKQIVALAKERRVLVQWVPRKKIDTLTDSVHQGVVAYVSAYEYVEVEDLLEIARKKNETPFLLLLDELEDPHNLGSIMRTADCVGAHGIIIPKRRSVALTETVAKASTGAIEHVRVARVTNLTQSIKQLKEQGLWVVGADHRTKDDYRSLDGTLPLLLVIGSEGKGISRLVLEQCDFRVKIPMVGHVTSLNASVSASLLMYEVMRKRNPLGGQ